jgi:glyoxylate reductase
MQKNILITRELPNLLKDALEKRGYFVKQADFKNPPSQEEIINLLKERSYDILVTLLTDKIDRNIFKVAPTLKMVANYATGFDNINLEDAKIEGVVVTNAPASQSAEAVAEHTISLMLALARKLIPADNFTKNGDYTGWDPNIFVGKNFFGKTLGLIGTGQIGKRVAKYARALGLNVLYFDVKRDEEFEKEIGVIYSSSVEKLLPQADFISLHVPLLPSTKHLINKESLEKMRASSYLINTSRGPVVDEKALIEALQNKVIAGAAIDVFEFEPNISNSLKKLENTILTPHIASASIDARNEMAEIVLANIIAFIDRKKILNKVN